MQDPNQTPEEEVNKLIANIPTSLFINVILIYIAITAVVFSGLIAIKYADKVVYNIKITSNSHNRYIYNIEVNNMSNRIYRGMGITLLTEEMKVPAKILSADTVGHLGTKKMKLQVLGNLPSSGNYKSASAMMEIKFQPQPLYIKFFRSLGIKD